ncbi:Uu.00g124020.m01.CDS01 [Anthostomella pinea]|uniref:Uu.00g124020.m01.CDS01 n=1 Tax=Anthostomella pinea TaxID=933095 RepID=A0AAI8YF54_9PEZI|nr:Uu.00g124020.m01.CDS01 [Anthostomella pinea]
MLVLGLWNKLPGYWTLPMLLDQPPRRKSFVSVEAVGPLDAAEDAGPGSMEEVVGLLDADDVAWLGSVEELAGALEAADVAWPISMDELALDENDAVDDTAFVSVGELLLVTRPDAPRGSDVIAVDESAVLSVGDEVPVLVWAPEVSVPESVDELKPELIVPIDEEAAKEEVGPLVMASDELLLVRSDRLELLCAASVDSIGGIALASDDVKGTAASVVAEAEVSAISLGAVELTASTEELLVPMVVGSEVVEESPSVPVVAELLMESVAIEDIAGSEVVLGSPTVESVLEGWSVIELVESAALVVAAFVASVPVTPETVELVTRYLHYLKTLLGYQRIPY